MDTPPPIPENAPPTPQPPPAIPERSAPDPFRLHPAAWIAWGIYAAASITLFFMRNSSPTPYALGELFGRTVTVLILPTIVAFVVWLLSRRSATAVNPTFFVVFAVAVGGQVMQFASRAQANATLTQLQDEQKQLQAEQRTAAEQGRPVDTKKAEKLAAQASEQLATVAQNSTGRERATAEGGKAYMDRLLAAKQRYDEAVKNLDAANFWSLKKFNTGAGTTADDRRKRVKAFAAANQELIGFQDQEGTEIRRAMAEHGASPADVEGAVKGYQQAAGARLALILKIRETDAQLAQAMLDFVDFAEANQGKWTMRESDGKVLFQTDEQVAQFNGLLKRVTTISTEQSAYQKQVYSMKN